MKFTYEDEFICEYNAVDLLILRKYCGTMNIPYVFIRGETVNILPFTDAFANHMDSTTPAARERVYLETYRIVLGRDMRDVDNRRLLVVDVAISRLYRELMLYEYVTCS